MMSHRFSLLELRGPKIVEKNNVNPVAIDWDDGSWAEFGRNVDEMTKDVGMKFGSSDLPRSPRSTGVSCSNFFGMFGLFWPWMSCHSFLRRPKIKPLLIKVPEISQRSAGILGPRSLDFFGPFLCLVIEESGWHMTFYSQTQKNWDIEMSGDDDDLLLPNTDFFWDGQSHFSQMRTASNENRRFRHRGGGEILVPPEICVAAMAFFSKSFQDVHWKIRENAPQRKLLSSGL